MFATSWRLPLGGMHMLSLVAAWLPPALLLCYYRRWRPPKALLVCGVLLAAVTAIAMHEEAAFFESVARHENVLPKEWEVWLRQYREVYRPSILTIGVASAIFTGLYWLLNREWKLPMRPR